MKVDYFNLGRTVALRRDELGLTQEELAEACELSPGYIGCIERADRKISIQSLLSLCYALRLSPNQLLHASLPEDLFDDSDDMLDLPLRLREPDYTLRNTLSNWYFADLPDESLLSEPPVTAEQLSMLGFVQLDEDFPLIAS